MREGALVTYRTVVPAEWVDYNGHLNIGCYMIAFDRASDGLALALGLGEDYLRRSGNSYYIVEAHLSFMHEVLGGKPIRIASRLIDADDKRVHFFHEMFEEEVGFLAATAEMLGLHIDLGRRRAAPFPPPEARAIAALLEQHRRLPRPAQLGRAVALRKRPPAEAI
ncbi:MAG: thioesterase family protein [Stellaceae bacterium]